MGKIWEIAHCFFAAMFVCLIENTRLHAIELSLTVRKTVFSHLQMSAMKRLFCDKITKVTDLTFYTTRVWHYSLFKQVSVKVWFSRSQYPYPRNGAAGRAWGHYQMDRLVFNGPLTKSANRSGLFASSYTEWGNTTRNKTRAIAVRHISEQSV